MAIAYLGIDHLGIAVRDLDAATATYGDALGLTVGGGETLPERGLEVRFIETGNARIELLGATRDDSEISSFLAKRGEGIHHICLRVADLDAALLQARQHGLSIVGNQVQTGAQGTRVAFIHPKSTHGVLIELVETTEQSS